MLICENQMIIDDLSTEFVYFDEVLNNYPLS